MKTTLLNTMVIGVLAMAILVLAGVLVFNSPSVARAGNALIAPHFNNATTTSQTWIRTNTLLVASTSANDIRYYMRICNAATGTSQLAIQLDEGKPADNNGATILSNGTCYEMTDENSYWGTINASSTNGVNTPILVTVLEYNYPAF